MSGHAKMRHMGINCILLLDLTECWMRPEVFVPNSFTCPLTYSMCLTSRVFCDVNSRVVLFENDYKKWNNKSTWSPIDIRGKTNGILCRLWWSPKLFPPFSSLSYIYRKCESVMTGLIVSLPPLGISPLTMAGFYGHRRDFLADSWLKAWERANIR